MIAVIGSYSYSSISRPQQNAIASVELRLGLATITVAEPSSSYNLVQSHGEAGVDVKTVTKTGRGCAGTVWDR